MTLSNREILEAVANGQWITDASRETVADAARAALARIDALELELGSERSRVVNLVSRITGKPGDLSNEAVGEASRAALALREENADLRAGAIPRRWVERALAGALLELVISDNGECLGVVTFGGSGYAVFSGGSVHAEKFPTLADALSAAAKES